MTTVVAAVLTVVLGAGCGDSESSSAPAADGEGAALYAANCASCHGAELEGTDLGPSHLSIVYEPGHHGDEAFESAIRNGAPQHHFDFGPMPPVEGLDDDEIDAIISFVRAEQERQGFQR